MILMTSPFKRSIESICLIFLLTKGIRAQIFLSTKRCSQTRFVDYLNT